MANVQNFTQKETWGLKPGTCCEVTESEYCSVEIFMFICVTVLIFYNLSIKL